MSVGDCICSNVCHYMIGKIVKMLRDTNAIIKVNEEMREREYNKKRHEEWIKTQPKIYCC